MSVARCLDAERADRVVQAVSAHENTGKGASEVLELEAVLRKTLVSLDEAERFRVVHSLALVENDLSRALLASLVRLDRSSIVRHEAAFALGNVGDRATMRVLADALATDESPLVRHEAAMALGDLGVGSYRVVLENALSDPDPEVSASCRVALELLERRGARLPDS